jgi:hypothetical protein
MNLQRWCLRLAALGALGLTASAVSDAWAITRSCSTGQVPFLGSVNCAHPVSGKTVARGGGGGAVDVGGDRYISGRVGPSSLLPNPALGFTLNQANFIGFQSNTQQAPGCAKALTTGNTFFSLFGQGETRCDTAVTFRISASFDE